MGEHKHRKDGEFKGDGYKKAQRMPLPARLTKEALMKEGWLYRHGWRKNEEGKWVHS